MHRSLILMGWWLIEFFLTIRKKFTLKKKKDL